jgi:prepilin-type processing-associated H-X9-DG protein
MRRRVGGFTLVELLIVIGILALLVGLLVPVLGKARAASNVVICTARLRELASATLSYTQEHRGYTPLAGEMVIPKGARLGFDGYPPALGDPMRRRYTYANYARSKRTVVPFQAAIAEYLKVGPLNFEDAESMVSVMNKSEFRRHFLCPSTDSYSLTPGNDPAVADGNATMISFSIGPGSRADYIWSCMSDYGFNEGLFGYHRDGKYASRRLRGHLHSEKQPAKLVLFADAKLRDQPAYYNMMAPWISWTPSLDSTGPVTLADALSPTGKAGISSSMFDRRRHNGQINVAFADGHVESAPIEAGALEKMNLLLQ